MRIFVTGATGYVGTAVLDSLLRGGHQVAALVRNAERAEHVARRGARPVVGDLAVPMSYRKAAAGYDGYVLTALDYSPRGVEFDRALLDTVIPLAQQRSGFLIYTSGVWVLGNTREPADEQAPVNPTPLVAWRAEHERRVLEAGNGLRSVVIRPGIVYGGSRGIVADMFKDASNGLMRVIGSGENRWPLIYDRDLGDLYGRLAGRSDASGVFHANDEGDERVNDLVEAIATHTAFRPEVRHVPLAEAHAKMGAYADALALDQIVRSPRARRLGWAPTLHSVAGNVARLMEEWRSGRQTV